MATRLPGESPVRASAWGSGSPHSSASGTPELLRHHTRLHLSRAFLLCVFFKIFEQFVKTRIKEEYKERRRKLLLAKEEFRKLLEESKVSPRYGRTLFRLEVYHLLKEGLESALVRPCGLTCHTHQKSPRQGPREGGRPLPVVRQ